MEQDKDAPKSSPEGDDELENLSSDEKAAFEKIMAEIAAATGGASKGSSEDSSKNGKAANAGQPAPDPIPEEETPPAEAAQANLDQIMAEISSKKGKKAVDQIDETNPEPPQEDLSKDQQAALDQIMAEIGSKRKAEKAPAPINENPEKPDEDLSQDQQAALDQIMAEIGSKRKTEKNPKDASESPADEALNQDQQAALDQIMAEIGSKRKADTKRDEDKETIDEQANQGQADPQADIEKIMAEIEAKKGLDAAEEKNAPKKNADNLTMEEFDDELSNLLSSAQNAPVVKPAGRAKTAESAKPEALETITAADAAAKTVDLPKADPETIALKEETQTAKEYPILKEISGDAKPKKKTGKGAMVSSRKEKSGKSRKLVWVAALAGIALLCIGGYWGHRHQWHLLLHKKVPDTVKTSGQNKPVDETLSVDALLSQTVAAAPKETTESLVDGMPAKPVSDARMQSPAMILSAIKGDLTPARQQIQAKVSDIQQLKSYYARGIEEETQKIEDALQNGQIPSFDAAMADKKIELALRAIQRRQTYVSKLDTPLEQLTAMSEHLLYMERRAKIYEVLQTGITGLPVEDFRKEVEETIGQYLAFNTQISVDRVEVQPPPLEMVWARIEADLKQKANLLAQRAPLNRAISFEICKGNYERKYLLSALSVETAQCLIKWDGKDMNLNGLTELTPDVAAVLAKWPGEWISLNGLRQLNAQTAKPLSQWQGKRISLNGLSELSREATSYLSQWKGAQLEMVGLQSIGSWENYGTRLYLSEKLRKQLEAQ